MIERKTTTGESICIFDNVFTSPEVASFEEYASSSLYKRIHISRSNINSRSNNEDFFGSIFSRLDIENFGLFETTGFKYINTIFTEFNIENIKRAWILCTESGTKYLYHTDEGLKGITFLYYMNSFWHPEWGGETIFCNNFGEPDIAIACKPNRVVVFPSYIPHKPSGITKDARTRYSFTTTFILNEQ